MKRKKALPVLAFLLLAGCSEQAGMEDRKADPPRISVNELLRSHTARDGKQVILTGEGTYIVNGKDRGVVFVSRGERVIAVLTKLPDNLRAEESGRMISVALRGTVESPEQGSVIGLMGAEVLEWR